jgi:hypothetical protein
MDSTAELPQRRKEKQRQKRKERPCHLQPDDAGKLGDRRPRRLAKSAAMGLEARSNLRLHLLFGMVDRLVGFDQITNDRSSANRLSWSTGRTRGVRRCRGVCSLRERLRCVANTVAESAAKTNPVHPLSVPGRPAGSGPQTRFFCIASNTETNGDVQA